VVKKHEHAARLTKTVGDIEQHTDLDFVVVLRRASGSYNDLALIFGAAVAFIWLCYVIYTPAPFEEAWWPFETLIVYVAAWAAFRHLPWRRHLPIRARFQRQVESTARAVFIGHRVDNTRNRMGILIYVSALEAMARILPDQAALAALQPGRLREFESRMAIAWARAHGDCTAFCDELRAFGEYCSKAAPRSRQEHELSDAAEVEGEA
jgi:uncharacterized membrane protein